MNKEDIIKILKKDPIYPKIASQEMIWDKQADIILELLQAHDKEAYKKGYNQCLKDERIEDPKKYL